MSKEIVDAFIDPPNLLPWSESFENFFPTEVLEKIRNDHPDDISEEFADAGIEVKVQILAELTEHGNYRKAAIMLDKFFDEINESEAIIMEEKLGYLAFDDIVCEDKMALPSTPDEFRKFFANKGFTAELLVDL
jgi:hypothetical protein